MLMATDQKQPQYAIRNLNPNASPWPWPISSTFNPRELGSWPIIIVWLVRRWS